MRKEELKTLLYIRKNYKSLCLIIIILLYITTQSSLGSTISGTQVKFLPFIALPCAFVFESEMNDTFTDADGPTLPNKETLGCFYQSTDLNDVYYFELDIKSSIEVFVRDIPPGHDYDVAVYNANFELIGDSKNSGNSDEYILTDEQNANQRYYIQIFNFTGNGIQYPYRMLVNYNKMPLPCNHLSVTEDVFSQVKDEPNVYPIYGPENDPNFRCEAVFNPVFDGQLSIKIDYLNKGDNFGYWGINFLPAGFDASNYSHICFQVHIESSPQVFRLKIKDFDQNEPWKDISVQGIKEWEEKCVSLNHYENLGVDLSNIENINIGFDKSTGTSTIWVDNFYFK